MMSKKLIAMLTAGLLGFAAASQAVETAPATEATNPQAIELPNIADPNEWLKMFSFDFTQQPGMAKTMAFNPAKPSEWMKWVDPKTHNQMHMAFANPATYAQFMNPMLYMEFMKPENMMAWMNPASYQQLMDMNTYTYWMNPGSYMHAMDPNMYTAMMDPSNYMAFMNPASYGFTTCPAGEKGQVTWFGTVC